MKKTKFTRFTAALLSLLMLSSAFGTAAFADDSASGKTTVDTNVVLNDNEEIKELLEAETYAEYSADNVEVARGSEKKAPTVDIMDYKFTTSDEQFKVVEVDTDGNGKADAILTPDVGTVEWELKFPAGYKTSKWAVQIEYVFPDEDGKIGEPGDEFYIKLPENTQGGKSTHIERRFRLNGKFPFKETRYLQITKMWQDDSWQDGAYVGFATDNAGNDKRPTKGIVPEGWCYYTMTDSSGYTVHPFEVVVEDEADRTETISLEATREAMVIKSIKFYPYEELKSYAEVAAEYASKGYAPAAGAAPIVIEAEGTRYTSDKTIYPANDRTSAITSPQSPSLSKLNTLGGTKWQGIGQWVEYTFTIETAGLYQIVPRYKQGDLSGMYTSRRLYIDGVIPFEEANYLQFNYSDSWQTDPLNNGYNAKAPVEGKYEFEFYFEPGVHTIRFEVVLGEMGDIIGRVQECLTSINNDYLKILQITGADPDEYRDYNFNSLIPDTIRDLYMQYLELTAVSKLITEINGVKGSNTATLDNIARVLERMALDEDEVARNMSQLKSYIGTLGTWLNNVRNQPVLFDYISIQPSGTKMPKAEANFFEAAGFEIGSFVMSFFTDYSSLGASGEKLPEEQLIDVWVSTGRDQAQVIRSMCDNQFSEFLAANGYDKIGVNLRLVTGGTLLPATLSGSGPDVALQNGQTIPVEYAIRSAVQKLNVPEFDTFDEVSSRFSESALVPLTLYGDTYGLPETQSFPMMFYRKDIFAELFPEEPFPTTWDDLMEMVPVLQYNNMQVGIPTNYGGLQLFLYQRGEDLYDGIEYDKPTSDVYNDGKYRQWYGSKINLDTNTALEAFDTLCAYFTQYSFPITYDAANRFRTGEMPIIFADYVTMYNQLSIFATEIRDLWGFAPVLGTPVYDEEGNIVYDKDGKMVVNNKSVSTVTTMIMMNGCEDAKRVNAWRFMDWYTTAESQAQYANEMVAIVGQGAMHATSNMEALASLPWSSADYDNIMAQHDENLAAIPEMPGGYIISRYVGFAFLAAYNEQADPVEGLLDYIDDINKEITRKRNEFGLETLELGETIEEKIASLEGEAAAE